MPSIAHDNTKVPCHLVSAWLAVLMMVMSAMVGSTPSVSSLSQSGTTITSPVFSQTTTTRSAYNALGVWNKRMAEFVEENHRISREDGTTHTGYIVLLGDSITQGFPHKRLLADWSVINRGISSDPVGDVEKPTGRGVIHRLHESVWECHPQHVFVLIGVNDIGAGIRGEKLQKRYADLLHALLDGLPATSITLQTILPARGRFARLNRDILDANKRLFKLAEERGISVLDTHRLMLDDDGLLREDFTSDGLHLNTRAYQAWAELLREDLARVGEKDLPVR